MSTGKEGTNDSIEQNDTAVNTAAAAGDETDENAVMKTGFVAGLLSSSCCLLQLVLNALSWFNVIHLGCAGFNKVLGPARPYLRAITFGWLGLCWYHQETAKTANNDKKKKPQRGRMLKATATTLLIMFLPEMLQTWNHSHPILRRTLLPYYGSDIQESLAQREFLVHNMGCEGCESAVRNIFEAIPDIEMAQVDWESGKVVAWGETIASLDLEPLFESLQLHGYDLDDGKGDRIAF